MISRHIYKFVVLIIAASFLKLGKEELKPTFCKKKNNYFSTFNSYWRNFYLFKIILKYSFYKKYDFF